MQTPLLLTGNVFGLWGDISHLTLNSDGLISADLSTGQFSPSLPTTLSVPSITPTLSCYLHPSFYSSSLSSLLSIFSNLNPLLRGNGPECSLGQMT